MPWIIPTAGRPSKTRWPPSAEPAIRSSRVCSMRPRADTRALGLLPLLQWSAVELAGGAISEAHPAGRDQIHLQAHHGPPIHVLESRPRHLDDIALRLVPCYARSRGMPAIQRRVAPRSAQTSEPGAELVADADVDKSRPALLVLPISGSPLVAPIRSRQRRVDSACRSGRPVMPSMNTAVGVRLAGLTTDRD